MKPWLKAALVVLGVFATWFALSVATFDDDPKFAQRIDQSSD